MNQQIWVSQKGSKTFPKINFYPQNMFLGCVKKTFPFDSESLRVEVRS